MMKQTVAENTKAKAKILQRRLKVGPKLTSLLDLGFSRVPHPGSNPHGA